MFATTKTFLIKGGLFQGVRILRHVHVTSVNKHFRRLRKATFSYVMCVCPSTWNNSAPTGRTVIKFDI